MIKARISIHSFLDIITNSSTELFVIDKEKGLEFVRETIDEILKTYPSEYGCTPSVYLENADYYTDTYIDEDEAVKYLRARGYLVEAPTTPKDPESIVVSWERGCMSREFIKKVSEVFETELIDF